MINKNKNSAYFEKTNLTAFRNVNWVKSNEESPGTFLSKKKRNLWNKTRIKSFD